MSQNDTLTRGQQRALAALLTCTSITEAAEVAGLGRKTIYRYLEEEVFRSELRRRQDDVLSGLTSHLVSVAGEAVAALHDVLSSEEVSASVRVRAANVALRYLMRAVELESLAERVRRLETVL